jgi:O-antigen/teichoic acid export membrane protein
METDVEKHLAGGAITALLIRLTGAVAALLAQVVLARVLSAEGFGIYIYALSIIQFLAIPASIGLHQAAIRQVAAYSSSGLAGELKGFTRLTLRYTTITACILSLLMTAIVLALPLSDRPGLRLALLAAAPLLPLLALVQLLSSALRGFRDIFFAMAPSMLFRPLTIGTGILVAGHILSIQVNAAGALAWNLLVTLSITAYLGSKLTQRLRAVPNFQKAEITYHPRAWILLALPLLFHESFNVLISKTDILLLGPMKSTEIAGHYAVAAQLSLLSATGLQSVNAIVAPMIAQYHALSQRDSLRRTITMAARLGLLATLPATLFLILFGDIVLGFFGPTFRDAYPALAILALGQLVNSASGPAGFLLTMTDHQHTAVKILGATAILNLALNLFLIPRFGAVGAAVATATSMTVWNLAMVWFAWVRIGIDTTALGLSRHEEPLGS